MGHSGIGSVGAGTHCLPFSRSTPVFTRRDADTLQGDSGLNAHDSFVGGNQNLQTSQISVNRQKDTETGSAVPRDTAAVMPLKTIAPSERTKEFILCDSLPAHKSLENASAHTVTS